MLTDKSSGEKILIGGEAASGPSGRKTLISGVAEKKQKNFGRGMASEPGGGGKPLIQ